MTLIIGSTAPTGPALPNLADPAVNPHGLTEEELRTYAPQFWPSVLQYGRKKFGLSSIVLAVNGAMNHLGDIGRRHSCQRSMQAPLEALQGSFVSLFQEVCEREGWTPDEIKKVQGEIVKAQVTQGTPKILAADGNRTLN